MAQELLDNFLPANRLQKELRKIFGPSHRRTLRGGEIIRRCHYFSMQGVAQRLLEALQSTYCQERQATFAPICKVLNDRVEQHETGLVCKSVIMLQPR